jgi:adenosine deaminase
MHMQRPLKLITALGKKADLVLEIIDFFNGGEKYSYRAEANVIRERFSGRELTEIFLICTREVSDALRQLKNTLKKDYPALVGSVREVFLDTNDIGNAADDEAMRKKVYDAVQEQAGSDLLIGSGGRQQVTQRLIEAGLLYGCLGYFTITAPKGRERREESTYFNVILTTARQFATERRSRIIKDELGDNFRSLYLLPAEIIDRLRQEKIGFDPTQAAAELDWLQRLPKADLHCHLGGSYDDRLLKDMAAALLVDLKIDRERQQKIIRHIEAKCGVKLGSLRAADLRSVSRPGNDEVIHALQNLNGLNVGLDEEQHVFTAVLVHHLSQEQVAEISRDGRTTTDSVIDWPSSDEFGGRTNLLTWYMTCGDLGGSALLQTETTLRLALRWLMQQAKDENVCFMEVRFSPDNYTKGGLTIRQVIDTLLDEAEKFTSASPDFHVHFLIMATRHKDRASMVAHVAAAVTYYDRPGENKGPRITGFDLAGQEKDNDPVLFTDVFMPLHHHFMNITIHAGEMEDDDKIWQALYSLHARRVGHGLKLVNNSRMMDYIRDYGIAIEMCPSSNIQTNGFKRFDRDTRSKAKEYPLKKYMEHGIAITVNTDNRGISDTTLANEYLEAARLTEGGLSKWEILKLIKNGFKAAFLPKNEKDRLLKKIDQTIFELLLEDL